MPCATFEQVQHVSRPKRVLRWHIRNDKSLTVIPLVYPAVTCFDTCAMPSKTGAIVWSQINFVCVDTSRQSYAQFESAAKLKQIFFWELWFFFT